MFKEWMWPIAGGRNLGPAPFFVVGILNVTPDSFYDGYRYFDKNIAVEHALNMLSLGADIIDIGGESTRPFSDRISLEEERRRINPVIDSILHQAPESVLSVDTYKAQVAAEVIQMGAGIVNDVTACGLDPELKDVLAHYKPGYVLMHSQGRPEEMQTDPSYSDVVGEILEFFERHLKELTDRGLPEENIVLDPGIGFGKLLEHNLTILREIERLFVLGRPLYIGLSNKSMWKKLLGLGSEERKNATQVSTALMAQKGVCLHRVHEVEATIETLKIVQTIVSHS